MNTDIESYEFEDIDLERAVNQLTEKRRRTVILMLMGYKPPEIAKLEGVTREAIWSRLKFIQKDIRDRLNPSIEAKKKLTYRSSDYDKLFAGLEASFRKISFFLVGYYDDDLLQEMRIGILKAGIEDHNAAYLYRVAYNNAVDYLRAQAHYVGGKPVVNISIEELRLHGLDIDTGGELATTGIGTCKISTI